jgi:hypothetical protein
MSENEGKKYRNYNPVTVTVTESVGILVLGGLALMPLVALLRSQSRHRRLLARLAGAEEAEEVVEPSEQEECEEKAQ